MLEKQTNTSSRQGILCVFISKHQLYGCRKYVFSDPLLHCPYLPHALCFRLSLTHAHTIFFPPCMHPITGQIGQLPKRDALERLLYRLKGQPIGLLTLLQMWQLIFRGLFYGPWTRPSPALWDYVISLLHNNQRIETREGEEIKQFGLYYIYYLRWLIFTTLKSCQHGVTAVRTTVLGVYDSYLDWWLHTGVPLWWHTCPEQHRSHWRSRKTRKQKCKN